MNLINVIKKFFSNNENFQAEVNEKARIQIIKDKIRCAQINAKNIQENKEQAIAWNICYIKNKAA